MINGSLSTHRLLVRYLIVIDQRPSISGRRSIDHVAGTSSTSEEGRSGQRTSYSRHVCPLPVRPVIGVSIRLPGVDQDSNPECGPNNNDNNINSKLV